jgi:dihydroorotate dehydrogenase (NAD+) catalytic subunit
MEADLLGVSFAGITLKNPILTAAGTFGYGREFADFIDLSLLGGLITKTVTLVPRPGNQGQLARSNAISRTRFY